MAIKPVQLFTQAEIEKVRKIFFQVFKIKPQIKLNGYDTALYNKGIKLLIRSYIDSEKRYIFEILEFTLPRKLRNQGLGTIFMKSFLKNLVLLNNKNVKIILIPLNKKALKFWKKLGFDYWENSLYLCYENSKNINNEQRKLIKILQ